MKALAIEQTLNISAGGFPKVLACALIAGLGSDYAAREFLKLSTSDPLYNASVYYFTYNLWVGIGVGVGALAGALA